MSRNGAGHRFWSAKRCRHLVSLALLVGATGTPSVWSADFIRGDVNQDGRVSISDAVYLKYWMFGGAVEPPCLEAANIDDSETINLCDELYTLTGPVRSIPPSSPFPEPGPDPTPGVAGESNFNTCRSSGGFQLPATGCESYEIHPAADSDDLIELGQVSGSPGETVEVPVYLTTSSPIEGSVRGCFYTVIGISPINSAADSMPAASQGCSVL